jgi:zinc transporter 9
VWDAAGSVAVGGLLGGTALYLINSNRLLLLGRSLGADKMQLITDHMRADPVAGHTV